MLSATSEYLSEAQSFINRNLLKVTALTPARTAIALMSGLGQAPDRRLETDGAEPPCIFVVEEDRLLGILTEGDVVRLCAQGQSLDVPISEVMTQPTVTLAESACPDILSAVTLLQRHRVQQIPVLDVQGRLVGILNQAILQSSELLFPALADSSTAGIFYLRADASCTYVSKPWSQITGISPEQAAGNGWIEHLHPDDRDIVQQEWAESIQASRPFKLEFRFQNAAGQTTWVQGRAVANQSAGQGVDYVGAITDISERKQAELALKTQIEFDRLVAGIASRFIQLSPSDIRQGIQLALQEIGEFTVVDTTYIFQYSSCKTRHGMIYEWMAPGLEPKLPQSQDLSVDLFPWGTAALLRGQTVYIPSVSSLTSEAAADRKSFEQFGIVSTLTIPLNDQNNIIGFVGFASFRQEHSWSNDNLRLLRIFADILTTVLQRQHAEAELRESEQRYDFLAEAVPVGIFRVTAEGNALYTNPHWTQMTGLSAAASLGTGWEAAIHPEDREAIIHSWLQTVKDRVQYQGEFRLQHPDGTVTWVLGQAIPERSATGEMIHCIGTLTDITERKAAEAERLQAEHIRDERNLFETIFEVLLGGYWDWDIENQQEYLSPRFKQMFGYEADELPNEPGVWRSIILPEDLSKVLDGFDLHFQSHGAVPFRCEAQYRHKNGSVVWILCSGTVINWDADGNPLRMIGCHIDITERKQTEQSLANYAREVEDLYNCAPCGYHSLDSEGKIININDTALGWLGSSREETLGKSFTEFVPADQILRFQAYFLEFKRSGRVKDLDFEIVCKNGTLLPVFLNSIAVEDSFGGFLHSRATLFDARDRKRAEETARINQERLELALEGSGDGLWDWNIVTKEVYLSPRWLEMLGYRTGDLPPKIESWLKLVHPEDRPHVTATLESYLQDSSVPHSFEYRMQHCTGEWRWIANFGKVVARDWTGQPLRIVGIHREITERKVAEQKIRRTSAQLEATNLELQSFSYSVSHDLRAPLRHIGGFVNALKKQLQLSTVWEDPKVSHYIEVIENSSVKMGLLIDGMLMLSRISRQPMVKQQVSIQTLVEETIALTQTSFGQPPNPIFSIGPLPIVTGDRTLLRQVFQNLIENAVKFSEKIDQPQIEIGSSADNIVWVKDNGAGFAMEYADQLFGPFQRLHKQSEFEGTGIGLAIVHRIVQRHGGNIWAESKPHEGSTFFIKFGEPDTGGLESGD